MITINGHVVIPTIFPDGTSQVWHLPNYLFDKTTMLFKVVWMFEAEREIIDLYSLRALLDAEVPGFVWEISIPYLPYARQDKVPSNRTTFNLHAFCSLMEKLKFIQIHTIDAHSDMSLFNSSTLNIRNEIPGAAIRMAHSSSGCDCIIFPDKGAELRYQGSLFCPRSLTLIKHRGAIFGEVSYPPQEFDLEGVNTVLIVDDLCDGGATFISAANLLRKRYPNLSIHLYVTHGLFSKGREHLEKEGITIHTTNSLIKNKDAYQVC